MESIISRPSLASDTDLIAENVRKDVDILGVVGTLDASGGAVLTGDSVVANVLSGKTFYKDDANTKLTGTMPNNAGDVASVSAHMASGTVLHVVPATGYTDGVDDATTVDLAVVDTDLTAGNIKDGVTILGVAGTLSGASTLTGNAVVGEVLSGKEFYKDDPATKLTGTMVNKVGSATVITPSTSDQTIAQGYYGGAAGDGKVLGDADLVVGNIKKDVVIFGVTGTYAADSAWIDTLTWTE